MKRHGLDLDAVDAVVITHFHADHFAGLPFLLLEARMRRRARPLTVVGPEGIEDRVAGAMDVLFPGAGKAVPFPIRYVEYSPAAPVTVGRARIVVFPVRHSPATSPHALRVDVADRVVAFSGDTAWTDTLIDAARDADLFVCEVSSLDGHGGIHLDVAALLEHRAAITCRRLVITHMGPDVLANVKRVAEALDAIPAQDGLQLRIESRAAVAARDIPHSGRAIPDSETHRPA
jgi:ribonuclease BN (tRNA processing enzyme)